MRINPYIKNYNNHEEQVKILYCTADALNRR